MTLDIQAFGEVAGIVLLAWISGIALSALIRAIQIVGER